MALSPFTKPGTHVVCVLEAEWNFFSGERVESPVTLGHVYVVEKIVPLAISGIHAVRVLGLDWWFTTMMFEPAVLPKQITEILDKADKPIDGVSPELENVDG